MELSKVPGSALGQKRPVLTVSSCAAFRDATDAAGHFDPPRRKTSSPGCSGQKLRRYRRRKKAERTVARIGNVRRLELHPDRSLRRGVKPLVLLTGDSIY